MRLRRESHSLLSFLGEEEEPKERAKEGQEFESLYAEIYTSRLKRRLRLHTYQGYTHPKREVLTQQEGQRYGCTRRNCRPYFPFAGCVLFASLLGVLGYA